MATNRGVLSFGVVCTSSTLLFSILCGTARAQAQSAEPAAPSATSNADTPRAPDAPTTARTTPEATEAPATAESGPSGDVQAFSAAQGMVRVHVDAGERPFAVYFGRGARPIADCAGPCEFWAWPAKYRVRIQQGDGPGHDATIALRVHYGGRYAFVPAHGKMQNLGLILGVSGPVIGVVGLVITAVGALRPCSASSSGDSCDTPTSVYVGLSALAVGGAMTAIGWPLYNHNRAHFQVSGAAPAAAVAGGSARVGLVALPRAGLGLGATFAF